MKEQNSNYYIMLNICPKCNLKAAMSFVSLQCSEKLEENWSGKKTLNPDEFGEIHKSSFSLLYIKQ